MPGHVNMMDDVLISQQVPLSILKSSLRLLISRSANIRQVFVDHVRARLTESLPQFTPPEILFSATKPVYDDYMSSIRCLFASKLAIESLPYLTHFVASVAEAGCLWTQNGELEQGLDKACGDIVQAIQALKESATSGFAVARNAELQANLTKLSDALRVCNTYCASSGLLYPFARAQLQVDDFIALIFPHLQPEMKPIPGVDSELEVRVNPMIARSLEYVQIGNLRVPRLFNGLWQMSSPAWGCASSVKQTTALTQLVEAGLLATDMADHYGDAELIYGGFRNRLKPELRERTLAASKWCVFSSIEGQVTADLVFDAVQERARRLRGKIDLLQFHWNHYENKNYLVVLAELVKLTKSHPTMVSNIGLCNFDTEHMEEVCSYLLTEIGEVGIVSNQIQFSLIDSRPLCKMVRVCQKFGIKLLTYGTFCGGFLSDRWLGVKSPEIYCDTVGLTPSQRKYFDVINTWGSWADLQDLLYTLKVVADKHEVDISNVATRWVLNCPAVGAVIVGTRLGVSSNIPSNLKVFSFQLDDQDNAMIEAVALGDRARNLFEKTGDCGTEYR